MSVIAWDGKTLAADRQATNCDMRAPITKIWRGPHGAAIGITGDMARGLLLRKWFEDGADLARYPIDNNCDDWARLIVASSSGLVCYERLPVPLPVESTFLAFGSGRDYAMGAMAMGADARQAVEVASRFCTGCGLGIDSFDVSGDRP